MPCLPGKTKIIFKVSLYIIFVIVNSVNLNSLRAFVVLSQTRSFSRAAAELRTVQPSVSRHIKTLEQELGYSLFERARRQVQLTARGAEFLRAIGPSVMQIFSTLEQQVAHTLAPDWKGVISIASLHDAGVQFLWPALIEFKRRFPLVDFNVNLVSTQEVLRLLGTGEVSLSLTSQTPTHKRLTYQALGAMIWLQFKAHERGASNTNQYA